MNNSSISGRSPKYSKSFNSPTLQKKIRLISKNDELISKSDEPKDNSNDESNNHDSQYFRQQPHHFGQQQKNESQLTIKTLNTTRNNIRPELQKEFLAKSLKSSYEKLNINFSKVNDSKDLDGIPTNPEEFLPIIVEDYQDLLELINKPLLKNSEINELKQKLKYHAIILTQLKDKYITPGIAEKIIKKIAEYSGYLSATMATICGLRMIENIWEEKPHGLEDKALFTAMQGSMIPAFLSSFLVRPLVEKPRLHNLTLIDTLASFINMMLDISDIVAIE